MEKCVRRKLLCRNDVNCTKRLERWRATSVDNASVDKIRKMTETTEGVKHQNWILLQRVEDQDDVTVRLIVEPIVAVVVHELLDHGSTNSFKSNA